MPVAQNLTKILPFAPPPLVRGDTGGFPFAFCLLFDNNHIFFVNRAVLG